VRWTGRRYGSTSAIRSSGVDQRRLRRGERRIFARSRFEPHHRLLRAEETAAFDQGARLQLAGATIETGAWVGRSATIAPGATVPAGVVVRPGATYP
jgi:hypothetical protein